jgi:hypothetical protein
MASEQQVIRALSSHVDGVEAGTLDERRELLDIFAAAYATPLRLREALLPMSDSGFIPYDLFLYYGLDADGPMGAAALPTLLDGLVTSKSHLADPERFMESDHGFPYDRNQPMRRVDWKLGMSAITPEGFEDAFLGVLRVIDERGETHPGVVTR